MRLISQSGDYDIPYESSTVVRVGELIFAYFTNYDSNRIVMGNYSTCEKAEKVMEMLHNVYTGAFYGLNIDISGEDVEELQKIAVRKGFGIIRVYPGNEEVKFEPANIIFRFPEDYEV